MKTPRVCSPIRPKLLHSFPFSVVSRSNKQKDGWISSPPCNLSSKTENLKTETFRIRGNWWVESPTKRQNDKRRTDDVVSITSKVFSSPASMDADWLTEIRICRRESIHHFCFLPCRRTMTSTVRDPVVVQKRAKMQPHGAASPTNRSANSSPTSQLYSHHQRQRTPWQRWQLQIYHMWPVTSVAYRWVMQRTSLWHQKQLRLLLVSQSGPDQLAGSNLKMNRRMVRVRQ